MVRVRQRDTHSRSHSHRDTVTAGCLLLYRNLPVSIPNSNYVYARRYFFAFWPPCCIRFQLVWLYLTEKCAALDITIARFHCIQRVYSLMVRHNYVKSGQCSRRHLKRILSRDATAGARKSCLTGAIFVMFFSESAHRLGIGN